MNNLLLQNKICVVTGTSRGIGKAITEEFVNQGAIVYANARELGSIDQWASSFEGVKPGMVYPQYYDINDYGAVKNAVLHIKEKHNSIDVLVNNASLRNNSLLGAISRDAIESVFSTNVFAALNLMQLVSRIMTRNKRGSIINLSSIAGVGGVGGQVLYSATKGAVISMSRAAAKELAGYGIRVNVIAPGLTDTEGFIRENGQYVEEKLKTIGFGRLATPKEIADVCVFLASDMSCFISGETINVNGCALM